MMTKVIRKVAGSRWVQSPNWFWSFVLATLVSVVAYVFNLALSEVDPGNIWGISYGTAASILMAGAGLYAARRRTLKFRGLGKSFSWVQFHVYGGALAFILVLMHTGFRLPAGPMNWLLWILSVWVTLTGLVGIGLQKWIPRILASGLAVEVVYERIPELVQQIKSQTEELIETCSEPVRDFYRKNLAPALVNPQSRFIYYIDITGGIQSRMVEFNYLRRFLSSSEKDALERLEAAYKTKLELDAHYTLQKALRWWLYTHVPPSLVLLLLIIFHLYAVLYY